MNYTFSEISFPSSDGVSTIYAEIYAPREKAPKGIVQLAHGMIDYVGRYKNLIDALSAEGYIFAGHHHLGHGKSAKSTEDFGYFADKDGVKCLIADMLSMNEYLHKTFPALPITVMGHSMGSFITRLYINEHPETVSGAVIHGTSGPNPLLPFGISLARLIRLFRGGRHRSKLITGLAFGSYNSKFPKEEGSSAWLTREAAQVADRNTDGFTQFIFTSSAYIDLFSMIRDCNRKGWFENYPKKLPTLVISGDADPVGNYGRGVRYVYEKLRLNGSENIDLKMYAGARHELFNETNRDEVFRDIISWLDRIK